MFCTAGIVVSYALLISDPHHKPHALLCAPTHHDCLNQLNGAENALRYTKSNRYKIKCVREPSIKE